QILLVTVLVTLSTPYGLPGLVIRTAGGDWQQWRGPNRNGISAETNWTSNWPADGPQALWQASVGIGFSSVPVSQGRAYTLGNHDDRDTLWCFDALTGRLLWRSTYPAPPGAKYYEGGPLSTPTIDRDRVYTISKWGQVLCLQAATGKGIWSHDLRQDGVTPNEWGLAGSPLIVGDRVILNAGSAGTALNRESGRTVWSTGPRATGYASPKLCHAGGVTSVLIFAAKFLVARDPQSGRELWRFPWRTGYDNNNPDPILDGDWIFISTYNRGAALLSLKDGRPKVLYDQPVLHEHLSPGIRLGDYLYAFDGEARFPTNFRCLELPTGQVKWSVTDPAFGSLICADGKLLILSESGELLVANPSPSGFKLLARAQVLGGRCWTPPVLANGLLYVRNARGDLRCLDLRRN
ncbi:MAG: PQQ-binding-like beta-propeller repeat protein, partial [Verrucomicrobia bacterium]|nr:PQQ-binding-like beta-propeller repeat protein [Verrucomicrobiota bacterium]